MYLAGWTKTHPRAEGDLGRVGTEIYRYDNWSKSPQLKWNIVLPYTATGKGYHGGLPEVAANSMDVEGERLFVGMQTPPNDLQCEVRVYETQNGKLLGTLRATSEIGSHAEFLDLAYGLRARRLSNDNYVIFVEEDGYAKIVYYMLSGEMKPR